MHETDQKQQMGHGLLALLGVINTGGPEETPVAGPGGYPNANAENLSAFCYRSLLPFHTLRTLKIPGSI
jgi:hypothetical protein